MFKQPKEVCLLFALPLETRDCILTLAFLEGGPVMYLGLSCIVYAVSMFDWRCAKMRAFLRSADAPL